MLILMEHNLKKNPKIRVIMYIHSLSESQNQHILPLPSSIFAYFIPSEPVICEPCMLKIGCNKFESTATLLPAVPAAWAGSNGCA